MRDGYEEFWATLPEKVLHPLRVPINPDDHREVEVAIQAIRTLEQSGLFCPADKDQRVVPTEAALLAFALLTR
jgi:hypothetical protein